MSAITCGKVCDMAFESAIVAVPSAAISAGLTAACTTFPVATAALFGALSGVCSYVIWVADDSLKITSFLGKTTLAEITRAALYCILAAAVTAGGATLAGFTVTIGGAAILAIAPAVVFLLLIVVGECSK